MFFIIGWRVVSPETTYTNVTCVIYVDIRVNYCCHYNIFIQDIDNPLSYKNWSPEARVQVDILCRQRRIVN